MPAPGAAALDVDALLADPAFGSGYRDVFDDREPAVDLRWSTEERLAYGRGRAFGVVVKSSEGTMFPLGRKGLPNPRTRAILVLAIRTGEVS